MLFGDAEDGTAGGFIYDHNDNSLSIRASGSEAMRINSSGQVGIGTSSPGAGLTISDVNTNQRYTTDGWSKYLELDAADSGGGVILWTKQSGTYNTAIGANQGHLMIGRSTADDNSAAFIDDFHIDSSGNVGIGTSTPDADLHIDQGAHNRVMIESNGPTLVFKEKNSTNENWSFYHNAGVLNIRTLDDSYGSISDKVSFLQNGNVGIGTSSPSGSGWAANAKTLHIYQNDTVGSLLKLESSNTVGVLNASNNAFQIAAQTDDPIVFYTDSTEKMRINSSSYVDMAGASDVRLTLGSQGTAGNNDSNWVRGNGTSISYNAASANHIWETGGAEKMRIDSDGNVGVNTTTPYGKFEVATLGASNNYNGNSAIRTGVAWDSEATTHTISYPDYCVGDTSSGMMIVHAKADGSSSGAKAGTLLLLWTKTHGEALTITTLHSHDQKISSFSASTSSNNIVITTDSDCAITWHSLFGR